MPIKCTFQSNPETGLPTITFSGDISENSGPDLKRLVEQINQPRLAFDVAGISTINSVGVIEWWKFIKEIPASTTYEFLNAPEVFVNYANLVPLVLGCGTISSVLIPYQCETCGHKQRIAATTADLNALATFAPITCAACALESTAHMAFEDYLMFLKPAPKKT